ncbi:MAG: drug/metabolite exporter YedA [Chloroflexi bacterium]|nr:drug/metabolite exporter YedA [Chloroflexota bacterium]
MNGENRNNVIKIVLAFAAIYIIWGTTYLVIRLAIETIPPFFMAGTRFLLAGIITFVFLRARGVPMPNLLQWRSAAIIGTLLLVGGNGLVTWSEQEVPSSIAALVVATVPLWMVLFDWLLYRGISPSKKMAIGLSLGFLGIGLLIGPGQILETNTISLSAILILLLAPILWSLGSLHSRQANLPENLFMATAIEMLAGGVVLILAGFITGETSQLNLVGISTLSLVSMLYLTIFGSVVALTAYIWLLKNVQAAKVATYTYVNPIIAIFLGWLILSEPITPQMLIPVVVIIVAVILITTRRPAKKTFQDELPSLETNVPWESVATGD